ncbi:MAG: acetyl-CoA hydrolase/transferase C-terminal domain-containing protein [Syntrophales bacterium]|nr:acetyl-CoA hydrolase/transferase C-terminal domain-containing protein [Syntrophales bacterium]
MYQAIWDEYRSKLRTAEEAVKVIKSGDVVSLSHFAMYPKVLDAALAKRKGEIENIWLKTICAMTLSKAATCDPEHVSFSYTSGFFSPFERQLGKMGLCHHVPCNYSEAIGKIGLGYRPNVAIARVTPMDNHGFFNLGTSCSEMQALIQNADKVILEINEAAPTCLGGNGESVHISQVDYIVETEKEPLFALPQHPATEEDVMIANHIIREIHDGSCVQLGIGGIPNMVGKLIADSDIKDLGVHSEMMCDAYMHLYLKGRISGKYKAYDKGKMVFTFALGSSELYEFLDKNPACATYAADYTNSPDNIGRHDNLVSINNALQVDLWGQICSESQGRKHISGSGGQQDFVLGAIRSKGGKAFLCMKSTRMIGDKMVSRIVPDLTGIVSIPRSTANYKTNIVTEYGVFCPMGKPVWQIAEGLIAIAHPDFRDELIKAAEERGLWRRSNKKG